MDIKKKIPLGRLASWNTQNDFTTREVTLTLKEAESLLDGDINLPNIRIVRSIMEEQNLDVHSECREEIRRLQDEQKRDYERGIAWRDKFNEKDRALEVAIEALSECREQRDDWHKVADSRLEYMDKLEDLTLWIIRKLTTVSQYPKFIPFRDELIPCGNGFRGEVIEALLKKMLSEK